MKLPLPLVEEVGLNKFEQDARRRAPIPISEVGVEDSPPPEIIRLL